jgi:diguanylate cyclase (GGDEF)-like protein
VLPGTDVSGATAIAETLRGAVEKREIRHPKSSVGPYVTASIGAATVVPETRKKADEVLQLADMALYQAKDRGRNRVCAFPEPGA